MHLKKHMLQLQLDLQPTFLSMPSSIVHFAWIKFMCTTIKLLEPVTHKLFIKRPTNQLILWKDLVIFFHQATAQWQCGTHPAWHTYHPYLLCVAVSDWLLSTDSSAYRWRRHLLSYFAISSPADKIRGAKATATEVKATYISTRSTLIPQLSVASAKAA